MTATSLVDFLAQQISGMRKIFLPIDPVPMSLVQIVIGTPEESKNMTDSLRPKNESQHSGKTNYIQTRFREQEIAIDANTGAIDEPQLENYIVISGQSNGGKNCRQYRCDQAITQSNF
jgi:hypothetical protein